ncbi:helix-turn-helix transcriptional regulator [Micromonospora fiedleri]|uniref:Helix-turn-helix transcriptional regulator n=1 Tax=Micromonospora fiedleri TaxID=1157498 RepID=A0ABS1UUV3_9ACTN|nr:MULTISPECIES: helix-turn-helix transcriptional regulator [Micromonospora]MBL6280087.1 helix-turn-helix transcriptional regulator [Micromonospora fiedleri]PMR62673.1 transcriptional regulator [Verrucosispora sp. ts21]
MTELGDYLRSCRAKVSAEAAGLPSTGHRRVPGLRREELAMLAGVSVDYIVRLEQGRAKTASPEILQALAQALDLRPDEQEYLFRCAADAKGPAARASPAPPDAQRVSTATRVLLDSMTAVPALVLGRRMDIIGWNTLGAALFTDFSVLAPQHRNHIRLAFLDQRVRSLYRDWETVAKECVAYLRMDAGRYPQDPALARLVGELSMKDEDFRHWWSTHRVRAQRSGRKHFLHPTAGELSLDFQVLDVRGTTDQTLLVYTAEPNSRSAQALAFLSGWTRTTREEPAARLTSHLQGS